MKTTNKNIQLVALTVLLFTFWQKVNSQDIENEWQTRTRFCGSIKLVKHLKLELSPELRFDNEMKLDRYHIETGLEYSLFKLLTIGGYYRYIVNLRDNHSTEYLNRYQLHATIEKSFNRWKPGFRLSYTDYTDNNENSNFLRYKGFLSYNIPNSKLTPAIAIEAFHNVSNSEWHKIRYSAGFKYKICKNNYIKLGYHYDYYMTEYKNMHIIDIGYKIKF